jgi:hypothetical protein
MRIMTEIGDLIFKIILPIIFYDDSKDLDDFLNPISSIPTG